MRASLTGRLKVKPLDTCTVQIRKGSPEPHQCAVWTHGQAGTRWPEPREVCRQEA